MSVRVFAVDAIRRGFSIMALAGSTLLPCAVMAQTDSSATVPSAGKSALTVRAVSPQREVWPKLIQAAGEVAAWQEAIIGSEAVGLRIVEINAQVGDRVRKGQLLARIADETFSADRAQAEAALAEAEAQLAEAQANVERSRNLREKGFYSPQQGIQYETALATARARRSSANAALQGAKVRLEQTRILAPDDGVVSARLATVGSLTVLGQELFRLIRQGRLEWRAEIGESLSALVLPGMPARITTLAGARLDGKVRAVSPSLNQTTRNAIAYVDIQKPGNDLRAGMFVRGEVELGRGEVVTVPQTALVLRDGSAFAFVLGKVSPGGTAQVRASKVVPGQRHGDRIAVLSGLPEQVQLVQSGAGFLTDGDTVRVEPAN